MNPSMKKAIAQGVAFALVGVFVISLTGLWEAIIGSLLILTGIGKIIAAANNSV
jgi:hypothetical protein